MKRPALILILICYASFARGQRLESCDAFWNNSKRMLGQVNPDYEYALKQLAAYKICNPADSKAADEKILEVYRKIKQQKDTAEAAEQRARMESARAQKAERRAIAEATRATALYLASESDKLIPAYRLRLLEMAHQLNPRDTIITRKLTEVVNSGPLHGYSEVIQPQSLSPTEIIGAIYDSCIITSTLIEGEAGLRDYFVRNTVTGESSPIPTPGRSVVSNAYFSPNGRYLIAECVSPWAVFVFEYQCGNRLQYASFLGNDPRLDHLAFSPEGSFLLGTSFGGSVRIWDLRPKQPRRLFPEKKLAGAKFLAKGQLVWLKEVQGSQRVYDLHQETIIVEADGLENQLVVNQGKIFTVRKYSNSLVFTDFHTGRKFTVRDFPVEVPNFSLDTIKNIYFSESGIYAVVVVKGKYAGRNFLLYKTDRNDTLTFNGIDSHDSIVFYRNSCVIYRAESFSTGTRDLSTNKVPSFFFADTVFETIILSSNGKYLMTIGETGHYCYVYRLTDSIPQKVLLSNDVELLTGFSFCGEGNFISADNAQFVSEGNTAFKAGSYFNLDDAFRDPKNFQPVKALGLSFSSDSQESRALLQKTESDDFIIKGSREDYQVTSSGSVYRLSSGYPIRFYSNEENMPFSAFSNFNFHIRGFKNGEFEIEDLTNGVVTPFPDLVGNSLFDFSDDDKFIFVHLWNQSDVEYHRETGDFSRDDTMSIYSLPSGQNLTGSNRFVDSVSSTFLQSENNRSPICKISSNQQLTAKAEGNVLRVMNNNDHSIVSKMWFDSPIRAVHFRKRTGEIFVELDNKYVLLVAGSVEGTHVFYSDKTELAFTFEQAMDWLKEFGHAFIPPLPPRISNHYMSIIRSIRLN